MFCVPWILAQPGAQGRALALANGVGALGSLPYNVNYFRHTPTAPDAARETGRTDFTPLWGGQNASG
ncbi:hypothetical protein [Ottowia sp.]|uniref:hypothetical protein n=1 Tax=Ottowia sp. TaxID=1898956 RepID=UPI0025E8595A|nr:hypothetical protein [Ottowia sp.]MBK6615279.1 hypothetical protein [Ottowia sp.]MBK6746352.1 hypothetical protein [Ottowia sp.]